MYVAGSHSLAPDVYEVADAAAGKDAQGSLAAARPIDPEASGGAANIGGRLVVCVGCTTACSVLLCPALSCSPLSHTCRPACHLPAAEGMNGLMAAPGGEVCPAVMPVPFAGLGDDITSNSVVCCVYQLPPHRTHSVQLLPGAQEEVRQAGRRLGRAAPIRRLCCCCAAFVKCGVCTYVAHPAWMRCSVPLQMSF
jgi:hypothetical protein